MAKEPKKSTLATSRQVIKLPNVTLGGVAVAKIFSIFVLIAAIVVIGALFYQVMASFFVPLFLATLLVVIFRPCYEWILHRVKGRYRTAAFLTTTFILLLVLLPAALIISVAAAQGAAFFRQISAGGISQSLDRLRSGLSLDLPASDSFRQLDEDFDVISVPLPLAVTERRIQEASDIVRYLQKEVATMSASEVPTERLLEDLDGLRERAKILASLLDTDDSISREEARRDYETQYANAKQSRRAWTQTILGNSFVAQLKMLANPSDAEIRSMIEGAQDFLEPRVLPLTQMAGKFVLQTLIGVIILVVALYFFFADGNSMIENLMRLSPLDDAYERKLLMQFDQTSRAVVLASVLSALAQGVLAALGFWVAGMPSIILLFMATTFMALVPFLGAASVWIPCAIYLATVEQRIGAAIGLAIFGAAVISSVDNVIKVFVLQGRSQIHPLLALLSVLGGLQVFGPIGILVGPMVVVFLQTLLEILNHELEGRAAADLNAS